jgi:hypothetical protein
VARALYYMPESLVFETRWGEFFSIYVILQAALDPRVCSVCNKMSIRSKKTKFLASRARPVRRTYNLTILPLSMSRFSRQCGILNILQPYRPPRSGTGIALLYLDKRYIAASYCVSEISLFSSVRLATSWTSDVSEIEYL